MASISGDVNHGPVIIGITLATVIIGASAVVIRILLKESQLSFN
jgi:hypothetical protein